MNNPLLAILTPAVPSRLAQLAQLMDKLRAQIGDRPVEHLVLLDNKRRPIGAKRQALLDVARADYVAFLDDDDDIADDYISELLPRCDSGPDVVTFHQNASIDGVPGEVIFDATCRADEPWKPNGTARRRPWHVCAWKRSVALRGVFTEVNYGEDRAFVEQVAPLARTHLHIPRVLHFYRHNSAATEAPAPPL